MEIKQIVEECIIETKERIKEKILVDNLIIFISRVIEDVSKDEDAKLFGRAKELYLAINPYSRYDGNRMLKFLRGKIECGEGMSLNDEEKHFVNVIFNEMDNDFRFKNGKVMKGRLKGILTKLCDNYFKESSKIIEPTILCRILSGVGGVERLKNMPASTIQLIGAEEALFRHLSKKTKSPKYGLIYYSRFVQQEKNKGKKARQLANKLAISIKVDYFQRINKNNPL